jgi:hypothetical protein
MTKAATLPYIGIQGDCGSLQRWRCLAEATDLETGATPAAHEPPRASIRLRSGQALGPRLPMMRRSASVSASDPAGASAVSLALLSLRRSRRRDRAIPREARPMIPARHPVRKPRASPVPRSVATTSGFLADSSWDDGSSRCVMPPHFRSERVVQAPCHHTRPIDHQIPAKPLPSPTPIHYDAHEAHHLRPPCDNRSP